MIPVSKAKTVTQTYNVMVKVTLEFDLDIEANSLAEAAEAASKLTISDVNGALPQDCYDDYAIDIRGVWRND